MGPVWSPGDGPRTSYTRPASGDASNVGADSSPVGPDVWWPIHLPNPVSLSHCALADLVPPPRKHRHRLPP
jgi:hypothetical protein